MRANPNRRSRSASKDGRPPALACPQLISEYGNPPDKSNDDSSRSHPGRSAGSDRSNHAADLLDEEEDDA